MYMFMLHTFLKYRDHYTSNIIVAALMQHCNYYVQCILCMHMTAGDHFYKENTSLPLEDQMISAMPDVVSRKLEAEDEFIVLACDGIW